MQPRWHPQSPLRPPVSWSRALTRLAHTITANLAWRTSIGLLPIRRTRDRPIARSAPIEESLPQARRIVPERIGSQAPAKRATPDGFLHHRPSRHVALPPSRTALSRDRHRQCPQDTAYRRPSPPDHHASSRDLTGRGSATRARPDHSGTTRTGPQGVDAAFIPLVRTGNGPHADHSRMRSTAKAA